jgi:hypothetical protein
MKRKKNLPVAQETPTSLGPFFVSLVTMLFVAAIVFTITARVVIVRPPV